MNPYLLLAIAIVFEVWASALLKGSNGFKKLLPTLGVVIGYGFAFYILALTLKTLPLGLTYAIWAGAGTALTALVGIFLFKEDFKSKKLVGLVLVIAGVVFLNFSGAH